MTSAPARSARTGSSTATCGTRCCGPSDAELVDLLVSTAVVDRMNYGLAEALTGRSDAGDLLLEAEERGLFVTGFDSGGWFEVHSLVREVLLAELERRSPERLREQHARAARWLESMGDGMAAIEHWLDAGEPAEALRLLAAISMSGLDVGGDRRDRPDPGTDPAGGLGRGCRLAGAVRLVPPARRPGRLPRRPRGGGGRGRRSEAAAGRGGVWASCARRPPGSPATGGPASTTPWPASSSSATRRRPTPSGGSAGAWWPTGSPSTSAGATAPRGVGAGRAAVAIEARAPARPRRGARGGSRPGRAPAGLAAGRRRCPAAGGARRRCGRCGPSSTSPRRSRRASSVTASEAEPALEELASPVGVPLHLRPGARPPRAGRDAARRR